jgi:hypothetical protein
VSVKTIRDLSDVVNVKVYETADLPPEIKPIASDLNVILKEFANLNKSKLKITIADPLTDANAKKEADTYGIQTLQFSSVKSDKFEVQNGYFGMVMLYNGKQEVLPVISDVGNLEYFMISGIKKLTSKQLDSVAVAEDNGTTAGTNLQYLRKYLSQKYEVTEATLDGDSPLPEGATTLLIAGRSTIIDDKGLTKINQWIKSGKGLITFLDRVAIDQSMQAKVMPVTGLEKIYSDNGMNIEDSLVVDDSATVANFSTQNGSFLVRYPYWPQILPENINSGLPMMSGINSLNVAWASPILTTSGKVQTLFTSSQGSSLDTALNDVSPLTKNGAGNGGKQKYALGVINTDGIKMALIGDSDMIKDNFVVNNQQNLIMALNLVDYFSQDSSLMAIRTKILKDSPLKTLSDQSKTVVKWVNIALPLVLLLISYGVSIYWRKRKINQWYALEK